MPILLKAIGRLSACTAACYDARHSACRCVCGGRNHGVGLKRAERNVRRMIERAGQQSLAFEESQNAVIPADLADTKESI